MTVFIIFFGAMLFFALELLHRSDLEIVTNQIYDLQAMYCADGGIERSLAIARFKSPWPSDSPGEKYNDGTVAIDWPGPDGTSVECTSDTTETSIGTYTVFILEEQVDPNIPDDNDSTNYNLLTITSCGTVGNFTRAVEAVVRRTLNEAGSAGAAEKPFYIQVVSWQETSSTKCP
ncbi:MAG: hypothetical protein ABIH66_01635 [bacterium]